MRPFQASRPLLFPFAKVLLTFDMTKPLVIYTLIGGLIIAFAVPFDISA